MQEGQATVDEAQVVALWERQAFDASALAAHAIRVIYRGVPSDAGGPDYQDAILSFGPAGLAQGDVEFHVRSSDWNRHGHHLDRAYNRVILHVVWETDDIETRRRDGHSVPRVALRPLQPALPLLGQPDCAEAFTAVTTDMLRGVLGQLGLQRFERRAEHFAASIESQGAEQVLYAALLEGMGYASNREAFRHLAEALPLAWLLGLPPEQWETALLEAAGFGDGPVHVPARLSADAWRLSRLRPANHPRLRLAGMARLLERLAPRPVERLLDVVAAGKPADLRIQLSVRQRDVTYIGPGRADELAVSVVLPVLAAIEGQADVARDLFQRYPSPPRNRWTRLMMTRCAAAGHVIQPRTAPEHQGMHALYHQHCRFGHHGSCPVCRAAK